MTALGAAFGPSSKQIDMPDFVKGGGSFRSRDLGYGGSHRCVSGVLNVRLYVTLGFLCHTSRIYKIQNVKLLVHSIQSRESQASQSLSSLKPRGKLLAKLA